MLATANTTTNWFEIVAFTTALISVISTSLLIIFYIKMPSVRTYFVKLLFYLAICDLITALSQYIVNGKIACSIQAGFLQFWSCASLFWMAAITVTMYSTVVRMKKYMWKYELLYHILCWPWPILSTIIMYAISDIKWHGMCKYRNVYFVHTPTIETKQKTDMFSYTCLLP